MSGRRVVVVSGSVGSRQRVGRLASALMVGVLVSGCSTEVPAPPANTPTTTTPTPSRSIPPRVSASPSATATATATAAPLLRIDSVSNFRDVAGDGLALAGGGRMATGVVYRSAKLATASDADVRRLEKAGIDLVIDLRTDYVASRAPDPVIRGADHELVNIYAVTRSPASRYRTVAAAKAHLRQVNTDFVAVAAQRARIARALKLIASADGPVIVHCTEGKDRTGWISALLQLVAGADRSAVMAEYLESNDERADIIRTQVATTRRTRGLQAARVEQALLRVDPSYLKAGLAEMDTRYGDVDHYLTEGLGLSGRTIKVLRERLTTG